jgi:tetratricopeptide (TPR) repeat protein
MRESSGRICGIAGAGSRNPARLLHSVTLQFSIRHSVDAIRCGMDIQPSSNLPSMLSSAATLRRLGQLEFACAVLVDATANFPNDAAPWHDMARLAEELREWSLAEGCWHRFLALDERQWWAFTSLATTLREQGREDEAEAVLRSAATRFPDETQPFHDLARLAEARRRWAEAEEHWQRYLALDDSHWWAHTALAEALGNQRYWEKANSVLATAQGLFPDQYRGLTILRAENAEAHQDWPTALQLWTEVQARFPDEWSGWRGQARMLRTLGRLDEAEAILQSAALRFPNETDVWLHLARLTESRQQWAQEEEHWRRLLAANDRLSWVYLSLVGKLQMRASWDEAEAILTACQKRFPDEYDVFSIRLALIAQARGDWSKALQCWEEFEEQFPRDWIARAGRIRTLRKLGRINEAVQLIEAAIFGLQGTDSDAVGGDTAGAVGRRKALASSSPAEIAARFESLGGGTAVEGAWGLGCEFAFFQRDAGVDQIGLLRWASIAPTSLAAALENRFDGIEAPDDLTIQAAPHEDWGFSQSRYGIVSDHTGLVSVSAADVQRLVCKSLEFLARKLISDLESDEKIFVYRVIKHEIEEGLLDRIARAIASYGRNRFLFVRKTPENKRHFSIDIVRPGFMIGYIDRFCTDGHGENYEGWEMVCRAALLASGG